MHEPIALKGQPACAHDLVRANATSNFIVHESQHAVLGRTPRHTHELATLTILLDGAYHETYGRAHDDVACAGQGVLLRPAGQPHIDGYGPNGAHTLVIEFPDETLRELETEGFHSHQIRLWKQPELIRLSARILETMSDHHRAEPLVEGGVFQLVADLIRLSDDAPPVGRPPPWLKRAQDFLHECFDDPTLRVRSVADAVDVHPVHLARVFTAQHGCAPGEYIRRLRLDTATRLLDSTLPLSEVAMRAGFSDQSHLTRAFRSRYGIPPGTWRRSAR